jgi:hypothetical protein
VPGQRLLEGALDRGVDRTNAAKGVEVAGVSLGVAGLVRSLTGNEGARRGVE